VPAAAVLSDPRPWAEEEEEGVLDDERGGDEANPLASRCFCASTSCARNVFCRLLKVSCLSGWMSPRAGVRSLRVATEVVKVLIAGAVAARTTRCESMVVVVVGDVLRRVVVDRAVEPQMRGRKRGPGELEVRERVEQNARRGSN
jgi:hypothetical protein